MLDPCSAQEPMEPITVTPDGASTTGPCGVSWSSRRPPGMWRRRADRSGTPGTGSSNWRNRAVRWGGGSDAKGAGEQPQLRNATPKHGSLSELLAEAVAGPTFGLRAAGRSSPVLAAAGPGGGHRRPGRSPMRRDRTTVRLLPLRRLAGRSGGPRHLLPQALGQGVPLTAIDTALGSDHLGPGTILVELDDRCEMFIGAAVLDCL